MTTYGGLFTQAELDNMEAQGYVRSNEHPDFYEMWILNYTEKATYEGVWNNVTLNCRGLIVDAFGNILARPLPKFFNYGQHIGPIEKNDWSILRTQDINLDEPAVVTDKMDGSLGILYKGRDGKLYIATRGSFTSDQAVHATEILRTKYADFKPLSGYTYLFEIIYPENRIVCDYADMDDLVFLGAVKIATGKSYGAYYADKFNWFGPKAETFPYATMREALGTPPRAGKEGFVVHLLESDVRVKIKQEDYIALHRIVTGLNARSVWQAIVDGNLNELIEQIPDEFHGFIQGVSKDIRTAAKAKVYETHVVYHATGCNPAITSRRDFAMAVNNHPLSWALFKMWDGIQDRDLEMEFIKRDKPAHDYSPVRVSNDAD